MTKKQIGQRLDERRAKLERVGARLNQIQEESARLSVEARQLQGAILELEDILEGPPLKVEDLEKAIKHTEGGDG
jgi:predicted nuclease with TOPRIM domain